jgi:folate-dependent phosphoribosylglycinamide formyltransferase PurN
MGYNNKIKTLAQGRNVEQMLKQLTEPGLAGQIDFVLRKRAAGLIIQLAKRLNMNIPAVDEIMYSKEYADALYKQAMNDEYNLNCT